MLLSRTRHLECNGARLPRRALTGEDSFIGRPSNVRWSRRARYGCVASAAPPLLIWCARSSARALDVNQANMSVKGLFELVVLLSIGCARTSEESRERDSGTGVDSSVIEWDARATLPDSITAEWLLRRFHYFETCTGPPPQDQFWARSDVVAATVSAGSNLPFTARLNALSRIGRGGHPDAVRYLSALADSAALRGTPLREAAIRGLGAVPGPLPRTALEVLRRRATENLPVEGESARRTLNAKG